MNTRSSDALLIDRQSPLSRSSQAQSEMPSSSGSLLRAFWGGTGLLVAYVLFNAWDTPALLVLVGALLAICALLPTYLWCAGKAPGFPIFPLMALTYLGTFALPLLTHQTQVARYDDSAQAEAAATAILFLLLATLVWWLVLCRRNDLPRVVFAIREEIATRLFLTGLAGCCALQMTLQARWLPIPWGLASILSAANNAASTLAVIVLSNRLGQQRLEPNDRAAFLILLLSFMVISSTSLVLITAMAISFVALIAFTLGRGKPPLVTGVIVLLVFTFFHIGKAPVRAAYWANQEEAVQPIDYPALYLRWMDHSLDAVPLLFQPQTDRKTQSLDERGSLIQMLLLVQSKTPSDIPYLAGETYALIPGLLVPRALDPDKPRSHEGTYILAVNYGLQTQKATLRTTIGFGLLAEAYANFGYPGVAGLAVLLGLGYGFATRWAQGVPLVSLRGMASLLALATAIQTEYTAGVLVTVLFQSAVVLAAAALLLMRPQPARPDVLATRKSLPVPL